MPTLFLDQLINQQQGKLIITTVTRVHYLKYTNALRGQKLEKTETVFWSYSPQKTKNDPMLSLNQIIYNLGLTTHIY